MYLSYFLPISILLLTSYVSSDDNIIMPYERFQYDLEKFLPVVQQEVDFAELSSLTDDQAYEQIKSFFPTLRLRVQQLRNTGITADEKRRKNKEGADQMCGQGHNFGYLIVDHKLRNIQNVLVKKRITVANNLKMLTDVKNALANWQQSSKFPCKYVHPKHG
ncbi:Protein CBG15073 [Caenorhabditis briggsae]|uniref:Protein CBG15073 n=2 Tax=Caenorhabditis briggsae TaxID=6238 RepID=A8XLB9_CAEBR|nr:Protein CBG15073 [Caenorhabditis briggsae]CAP33444.2 Protein CBG15073 [Caenorhabditis briggsae]